MLALAAMSSTIVWILWFAAMVFFLIASFRQYARKPLLPRLDFIALGLLVVAFIKFWAALSH